MKIFRKKEQTTVTADEPIVDPRGAFMEPPEFSKVCTRCHFFNCFRCTLGGDACEKGRCAQFRPEQTPENCRHASAVEGCKGGRFTLYTCAFNPDSIFTEFNVIACARCTAFIPRDDALRSQEEEE